MKGSELQLGAVEAFRELSQSLPDFSRVDDLAHAFPS